MGLIGCGYVALSCHIPAICHSPEVELVAVVDADLSWAQEVATRFLVPRCCQDYREVFGEVEAAIVALPPHLHAEVSAALLRQGIHVLCEKPMATSVRGCQAMLEASEEGAARLAIGHQRRFRPNITYLHDIVERGWLGQVSSFHYHDGWRQRRSSRTDFLSGAGLAGVGHLMEYGTHVLDMLQWLLGPVTSCTYSDDRGDQRQVEDNLEMSMGFAGGASGLVRLSRERELANRFRLEGDNGWAELAVNDALHLTLFKRDATLCSGYGAVEIRAAEEDRCFAEQLGRFVRYIGSGDAQGLSTGVDGWNTIRIVEECYRSGGTAAALPEAVRT